MPLFPKPFLVGAVLSAGLAGPALGACRDVSHLGQDYIACTVDPADNDIRLYNKDQAGVPFRSFRALSLELRHRDEYM
ncbi:MAG: phosphodiester glycosidase family protein, partial [Ensifer adhaerens]